MSKFGVLCILSIFASVTPAFSECFLSRPNVNVVEQQCISDSSLQTAKTLIILLDGKNQVYYYRGMKCNKLFETSYRDLKDILIKERSQTLKKDLMILIKSTTKATLKNVIDVLDEIVLAKIPSKHYAEEEITTDELNCIKTIKH